ncbi:phosphatase PAP2 family protein [Zhihengliuella sp.]|uniref:phosphatase PAP2 family protein n=1 Tax=Zhihengliuella sp. TaxID=1954483 RepID=UPI002812367C|nr:phosphatase PAP2 family protein [Zhihengliuella sp.]
MTHTSDGTRRGGRDGQRVLWPVGWIVALLVVAAAFAGIYWLFVLTPTGQQVDDDALRGANVFLAARDEARLPALALLGELPRVSAVLGAIALVTAAIVHRSVTAPLITLLGTGGALLTTQLLKHELLARPDMGISEATVNSFPSGHTTLAAASMFAVYAVVTPRWRPLVALLGGLFAAVAGMATLVLGWHRPADIVGAYLVTGVWALLTGWCLSVAAPRWNRWHPRPFWAASRIWSVLLWVPGLLAVGSSAGLLVFLPSTDGGDDPQQLLGFLLGGVLAIGSAALLSFGLTNAVYMLQSRIRPRH